MIIIKEHNEPKPVTSAVDRGLQNNRLEAIIPDGLNARKVDFNEKNICRLYQPGQADLPQMRVRNHEKCIQIQGYPQTAQGHM